MLGDELVVHPFQRRAFVIERADVQRVHATPLGERLEANVVESCRTARGSGLLDCAWNVARSIQSGAISSIVQSHWDLSRTTVKTSMSSAHHSPSSGGTT